MSLFFRPIWRNYLAIFDRKPTEPWLLGQLGSGRLLLVGVASLAVFLVLASCTGASFSVSSNGWTALAADVLTNADGHDVITLYVGTREGEVLALDAEALGVAAGALPLGVGGVQQPLARSSLGDSLLWSFQPDADPELGGVFGPSVIGSEIVYVGFASDDGDSGTLFALKKDRDRLAVDTLEPGEWFAQVEGMIVGGPVLAPEQGLVLVGSDEGIMYAFDTTSGDTGDGIIERFPDWQFPLQGSIGPIWSTPVVRGSTVYFGSLDHNVYALSLNTGTPVVGWPFETGGSVKGRPLLLGDQLFVGSFDRKFYAIDAETGTGRSLKSADNWFWAGAVTDGSSIFASSINGQVFILDRDGRGNVEVEVDGKVVARPAILEGAGQTWVVVVNESGDLFRFESRSSEGLGTTGKLTRDVQKVDGSRVKAPLVTVGENLFFSDSHGTVWGMELDSSGLDKLWSLDTTK